MSGSEILFMEEDSSEEESNINDVAPRRKRKRGQDDLDPSWTQQDVATLLSRMKSTLPEKDNRMYRTSLKQLDWRGIAFDHHSPEDCQKVWQKIGACTRKHRLLSEVLGDVKKLVKKGNIVGQYHAQPTKPPKPNSAYVFFIQDNKQIVKQANRHISSGDLLKLLAKKYHNLSNKERAKYDKLARNASEEYRTNRAKFYMENPTCLGNGKLLKQYKHLARCEIAHNSPKTPFEIYVGVQIKKRGEMCASEQLELMKDCKIKWSEMEDAEKVFWIKWAEDQYTVYKQDHPEYKSNKLSLYLSVREREILKQQHVRPSLTIRNAHLFFMKKMREKREWKKLKLSFHDAGELARQCWSMLTERDKLEYRWLTKNARKQYVKELQDYIERLPVYDKFLELHRDGVSELLNDAPEENIAPAKVTKQKQHKRIKRVVPRKYEPELPESTIEEYYTNLQRLRMRTSTWDECPKKEKKFHLKNWLTKKQEYVGKFAEFLQSLTHDELQDYASYMPHISHDGA